MENKGFKFFKKGSAFLIAPALSSSFLPGMSANTVGGNVASKAASESAISKFGAGTVKFLGNHWVLALLVGAGLLAWWLWPSNESGGFPGLEEDLSDENRVATVGEFEKTFWRLYKIREIMVENKFTKSPPEFYAYSQKDEDNGSKLVPVSMSLEDEIIFFQRKDEYKDKDDNNKPLKKGLYRGTAQKNGQPSVPLTIGYLKDFEKKVENHLKGLLKNPEDWSKIESGNLNVEDNAGKGQNINDYVNNNNINNNFKGNNSISGQNIKNDFKVNNNNDKDVVDQNLRNLYRQKLDEYKKTLTVDSVNRQIKMSSGTFFSYEWVFVKNCYLIKLSKFWGNGNPVEQPIYIFPTNDGRVFGFRDASNKKDLSFILQSCDLINFVDLGDPRVGLHGKAFDGQLFSAERVQNCSNKKILFEEFGVSKELDYVSKEQVAFFELIRDNDPNFWSMRNNPNAINQDIQQQKQNMMAMNNNNGMVNMGNVQPMMPNMNMFNNMPPNNNMGNNGVMMGNNNNQNFGNPQGMNNGFQGNNNGFPQQMGMNNPQFPQGQQGQNFQQPGYNNNNNVNNFNNNMPPQQPPYGNNNFNNNY